MGLQTEVCRLHEKLDEDTKTKEVVQSGYDELTADVETRTEMHKETITNFQARTTNSRKLSVDLGQQVTIFFCLMSISTLWCTRWLS